MTQENRTALKAYFETGDSPTQAQFANLIDSNLNLSENNQGTTVLFLSAGSDIRIESIGQLASGIPTWDAAYALKDKVNISTADVANPPLSTQLDSAFGLPATVGAGFIAFVDDAGAGANFYVVGSDGTYWWQTAMTKALGA